MQIGNVTIKHPYILAPMAGVTDLPFRLLCKEQGAGLLCMEMISAKALQYKNKNIRYHYSSLAQIRRLYRNRQRRSKICRFRYWILTWAVRFQKW